MEAQNFSDDCQKRLQKYTQHSYSRSMAQEIESNIYKSNIKVVFKP